MMNRRSGFHGRLSHVAAAALMAFGLAQAGGSVSAQMTVATGGQAPARPMPNVEELVSGLPGMRSVANAPPMPVGGGLIIGRAVDAVDRGAISGAIVTLSLGGSAPVRVQADAQGRFAFRNLPSGSFSITSTRPGYVDGASGRTRPGGPTRAVTLADNQQVPDVEIPMWRYAAVTGVVRDERGDPMVGVQVRVLRDEYVAGRRQLTLGATDTTDDRGYYRIGTLTAGDYLVSAPIIDRPSADQLVSGLRDAAPMAAGGGEFRVAARVEATAAVAAAGGPIVFSNREGSAPPAGTTEDGLPLTYRTTFYPDASAATQAMRVTLTHGEERAGVDFTMIPVRALSISGMVTGPEGPAANVQIQLVPAAADDVVTPLETATTTSSADGSFTFARVPAGQYTLRAQRQARASGQAMTFTTSQGGGTMMVSTTMERTMTGNAAPLPETPTLWAEMPVSVGTGDLGGLTLPLRTGLTVNGTVVFRGAAEQPTPEQRANLSLTLEPADGRTADVVSIVRGRVDANGTFTTIGVPAGAYVLRVQGAPSGWSLRDAEYNGRDITSTAVRLDYDNATGVTVTFTDRPTEVTGTVRDSSGNPDPTATVVVFPTDPAGWTDVGSQPRRLRQVRATQEGTFTIGGLPAGEYAVIAVEDASLANWQDPEMLRDLARASTTLRLADGETRTLQLTTVKGGR